MGDGLWACPFCGKQAKKYGVGGIMYAAGCDNRDCGIFNRPLPINQWNVRAEPKQQEYNKYEICKLSKCAMYIDMICNAMQCNAMQDHINIKINCPITLDMFFKYLEENNCKIVKKTIEK